MGEVIFRRIRGRLVPIRKKDGMGERPKKAISAAAYTAGGVAVGVGAGKLSARMLHQSANLENAGRDLAKQFKGFKNSGPLYAAQAIATGNASLLARVKSMRIFKGRTAVLGAGKLIAASLFGVAATDAFGAITKGKDEGKADDFMGHIAGAAAGAAVLYPYYKGAGAGKFGAVGSAIKSIRGLVKVPKKLTF